MDDTIKIKVNENGKWLEYSLSYEDFDIIQPILDRCKDKKECTFDPTDPISMLEMIMPSSPFGMAQQQQRRCIIYNLKERPQKMTKEEVIATYKRDGVLFVESDNTPTQIANF